MDMWSNQLFPPMVLLGVVVTGAFIAVFFYNVIAGFFRDIFRMKKRILH